MAAFKLQKTQSLFSSSYKTSSFFSTWYSPPPPTPSYHEDPILSTISDAIKNCESKPLQVSLKKILPSLKAHHVINLINKNPNSLSPQFIFSFFNFLSSCPTFRHTIQSYCTMVHFLFARRMHSQAQSLLHFVVSRKGKDSAYLIFASILETKGFVAAPLKIQSE